MSTFGELPSGVETAIDVEIEDESVVDGQATDITPAKSSEQDHDEDGEDGDDVEHAGATDEERGAIRVRRKEERVRRKNAAKAREEGHRRIIAAQQDTINQLAGRVAAVERSGISTHISHVDAAIRDTDQRLENAAHEHATAVSLGDGAAAAAAVELMMDLRMRKIQLDGNKRQLARAVQEQPRGSTQPQQAPAATPLPEAVRERAGRFIERHAAWYNPAGGNAESKIVMIVDQSVAEEGFDPSTDDYWDEVEARLKNYLPHRINVAHNSARSGGDSIPRSPVGGSSRSQAGGGRGGKSVYTLSAERVAAMKESGAWDDPVRKAEQIKRFRTYDAEQKGGVK